MKKVYIAVKSKKLDEKYCTALENSRTIEITGRFNSLIDCSKELKKSEPDVLLLGMNLAGKNWVNYCKEVRKTHPSLKVLIITSYLKYAENKEELKNPELTSGYISENAPAELIVSGIETVLKDKPFYYEEFGVKDKSFEWMQPVIDKTDEIFKAGYTDLEKIEKLSQMIDAIAEYRRINIEYWLANELAKADALQDKECIKEFSLLRFEDLFLKEYPNWKIADDLHISVESVRKSRADFIRKIADKSSVIIMGEKKNQTVAISGRELTILELIAAGYSNNEIAVKRSISVETVKTHRKNLVDKFNVENTMEMVIKAMRLGMIKLEDLDDLIKQGKP